MFYDVAIVGGGPAGAAAAITAARSGATVLLLERGSYPRHKVCGEFISAESLGLLSSLVPRLNSSDSAPRIAQARIFAEGRCARIPLKLAGISLSRFVLDEALWHAAEQAGVDACQRTAATGIQHDGDRFEVDCGGTKFSARILINAAGRYSNLSAMRSEESGSRTLEDASEPSLRFLGLKAHFHEQGPMLSSDLYFFQGGYCGVQPVGDSVVNACALVRHGTAKNLSEVFKLNPELSVRSKHWPPAVDEVRTFPAIFTTPQAVQNGMLCAGDAAGFIDPFLGDGISLALRTGEAAGRNAARSQSSPEAGERYACEYQSRFSSLFANAARMRKLLTAPRSVRLVAMRLLSTPAFSKYVTRITR